MATQIILFIRKRKSLRFNQVILNKLIELVPKLPSTLIKDAHKPVIELCAGRLFAG